MAAEETLREIAEELADLSTSVSVGEAANLALFYGYLAEAFQRDGQEEFYAERALIYLNDAIRRAPDELRQPYLCGGYAGLGWVIANLAGLEGKLLDPSESENCEAVDEAIIEFLQAPAEPLRYELLYGLAGLGAYALERLPQPAAVEILRLVIEGLSAMAERSRAGVTWFTPPDLLPESHRLKCPNGYYNLGLAHGVPGVAPTLARACAVEQTRAQAWELLQGAGQWLRSQQIRDTAGTSFPHWLAPEIERRPGRLAWCYGSLGAATAWLDAARRTRQSVWEGEAMAMLRRAARTSAPGSGVHDAGLCHGAAGNAHIFNRLYQATGEEIFERAALRWYEHALSLRQPGTGLAGYRMWAPSESGEEGWENSPDLLDGVAGVGLALLAACTNYEPQWDRLLAVSLS
ncbi:MAG: lanthionine synthetase C family protein [Blastocatellia bacterium]